MTIVHFEPPPADSNFLENNSPQGEAKMRIEVFKKG